MQEQTKLDIIQQSWQIHAQVEASYRQNPAVKGDDGWAEKQRMLLADMAIHLLQTALKPESIELDKLTNNIYSILTISDEFLPDAELKKATDKLF